MGVKSRVEVQRNQQGSPEGLQEMDQKPTEFAEEVVGLGVRPLRDQVVVRQMRPKDRLDSGLYIPQSAEREFQEDMATVLAIGPKVVDVAVGDVVLFGRRPNSALIPDRNSLGPKGWEDVLVLREEDMIAVVE